MAHRKAVEASNCSVNNFAALEMATNVKGLTLIFQYLYNHNRDCFITYDELPDDHKEEIRR